MHNKLLFSRFFWLVPCVASPRFPIGFVCTFAHTPPRPLYGCPYGGRDATRCISNRPQEARWPNVNVGNLAGDMLQRRIAFQPTGPGSEYGTIVDPALSSFNFSWDGALATLQVAHQFYTWTRRVQNHSAGGASFSYDKNLPGLASWGEPGKKHSWDQNQYSLSGVLGALDAPGEWFVQRGGDPASPGESAGQTLFFYPPDCKMPADASVEIKVKDIAIASQTTPAAAVRALEIDNFRILGSTLVLKNCTSCRVSNLRLIHPTFNPQVPEEDVPAGHAVWTTVAGTGNAVVNFTLSGSNNGGLKITGEGNLLDNCLIENTDWFGTLTYPPLQVEGTQTNVTRCTVRNFGNAGVVTSIANSLPHKSGEPQKPPEPMARRHLEVAYCHIYHGGLIGKDSAALYTGGWSAAGLHWHHNWVHDASEKCVRADDQSRNISVHHNVMFNCGQWPVADVQSSSSGLGLIVKGNHHHIYANTIFRSNYTELCLPSCPEPVKPFRPQYPFDEHQNSASQVFNTVARNDLGFPCSCHNSTFKQRPGGNQTGMLVNLTEAALRLTNVSAMDFRPLPDSPLVDAGIVWAPFTDGFKGAAPDVGAYELGGERWSAGCSPDLERSALQARGV